MGPARQCMAERNPAASRRCRRDDGRLNGFGYACQSKRPCEASALHCRVHAPRQARGDRRPCSLGLVDEIYKFLTSKGTYAGPRVIMFHCLRLVASRNDEGVGLAASDLYLNRMSGGDLGPGLVRKTRVVPVENMPMPRNMYVEMTHPPRRWSMDDPVLTLITLACPLPNTICPY
jgi:hypothetical protein